VVRFAFWTFQRTALASYANPRAAEWLRFVCCPAPPVTAGHLRRRRGCRPGHAVVGTTDRVHGRVVPPRRPIADHHRRDELGRKA